MKKPVFVYHPSYYADIGTHVFPMDKFRLLHDRLVSEGLLTEADFRMPEPATAEQLKCVHSPQYVDDLFSYEHTPRTIRSELPLTEEIVRAFALMAGGTILAAKLAVKGKTLAMNIGGGFHHAFADHAEGFCYINDVAVAVHAAQRMGVGRVAIVDCDVHQGNGTASIFANDPSVFTYSIHQRDNYPVKERSSFDRELEDEIGDGIYLADLEEDVEFLEKNFAPELVFYIAGADPYSDDLLGGLNMSKDGLRKRDEVVFRHFYSKNIPVVAVLAGGYAPEVRDIIDIHFNTCGTIFSICEELSRCAAE